MKQNFGLKKNEMGIKKEPLYKERVCLRFA